MNDPRADVILTEIVASLQGLGYKAPPDPELAKKVLIKDLINYPSDAVVEGFHAWRKDPEKRSGKSWPQSSDLLPYIEGVVRRSRALAAPPKLTAPESISDAERCSPEKMAIWREALRRTISHDEAERRIKALGRDAA